MINGKRLVALCTSRVYEPQTHGYIVRLNELLKDEGMDLSTLYRNLNALTKASLVLKEVGPSKENLYSLCQEGERHLLVCLRCGKKMPLEGCPYEEANEGIYEKTGFVVLEHKTEIYGVCPKCAHGEKPHHHN